MAKWSSRRVDDLSARLLQCYRCLQNGHVRNNCRSDVDRSGRCFACGVAGHNARYRTAKLNCPFYLDLGCSASHRLGSRECNPTVQKSSGTRHSERVNGEAGTLNSRNLPQEDSND